MALKILSKCIELEMLYSCNLTKAFEDPRKFAGSLFTVWRQAIAALRAKLSGAADDQGILLNGAPNEVPTDSNGLTYTRSIAQVCFCRAAAARAWVAFDSRAQLKIQASAAWKTDAASGTGSTKCFRKLHTTRSERRNIIAEVSELSLVAQVWEAEQGNAALDLNLDAVQVTSIARPTLSCFLP